jgi:hypothetical protein
VGTAIIVLGTNVSAVTLGKLTLWTPSLVLQTFRNPITMQFESGIVRVNNLSEQPRSVQAYPSIATVRMGPRSARLFGAQH